MFNFNINRMGGKEGEQLFRYSSIYHKYGEKY